MVKPTFFVIGAAKSGSTSFCDAIAQHPDVCFSAPKEPRFFSHDENFERGWDWYEKFFPCANTAVSIGEGSVHYSMRSLFPETSSRIARLIPSAKLVYIVRHPIDRIVSHWRMLERTGKPEFSTLSEDARKDYLRPNLIDASKYWFQISAYRELFPDQQILVLFFEDFIRNPKLAARECFRFLGLEQSVQLPNPGYPHNAADRKRTERRSLRAMRSTRWFNLLRRLSPTRAKNAVREAIFMTSDGSQAPEWDPAALAWVVDQVRDDAASFLEFYGKRPGYWSFTSS